MKNASLKNILTKEMLEYNYKQCGSMQKMAELLNVSVDSIYKYMKLYNISYDQYYTGIYDCNHNIFVEENEKSFYLAGFVAADGSVQYRKYSDVLKITLSAKDQAHLEKIKILLNSTHPIKNYSISSSELVKRNDLCSAELQIASKQICDGLAKFNIIPNKTFIYTFPEWLKDHPLVHHFMRGYHDGDGTWMLGRAQNKTGRTVRQMNFSLLGTKKFMTDYNEIIENNIKYPHKDRVHKKSNIYTIRYCGNKICAKITQFLYKDATIYLDRKYEKVKHLLAANI